MSVDDFASFAGARASSVDLVLPLWGMWSADVTIALDDVVPELGALVFGNLTLHGFVYRQALYGGSRRLRLIAGFGGWRKPVDKQQYSLSSGVRVSLLLGDVARMVGERVNVPADRIVGPTYVRAAGVASDLRDELAGDAWYIDPAGTTQIAAWPAGAIRSAFMATDQDGAAGRITIATEDYAEWLPGKTFSSPLTEGTYTARGIEMISKSDGIARVEVLT